MTFCRDKPVEAVHVDEVEEVGEDLDGEGRIQHGTSAYNLHSGLEFGYQRG